MRRRGAFSKEHLEQAARHNYLLAECRTKLDELGPLESYWAFPGKHLFADIQNTLNTGNYGGFAHKVDHVFYTLKTDSYRRRQEVWEIPEQTTEDIIAEVPDYASRRELTVPYFEVLVVNSHLSPQQQSQARKEIRALRRPEDRFIYELVYVPSFEDALVATIINFNVQAVIIHDGFPYGSQFDYPEVSEYLTNQSSVDVESLPSGDYALALAEHIELVRPELDVYIVTDASVEELAGSINVDNVKRVFYGMEEALELHLSMLAGVQDRFETPYFDNLVHYARQPVGSFHALPVARGKSVFNSHWIADMGHFYGTSVFLAESSATSGGLDSLLEPTGNIKRAQEKAARCFGADRTYFVTNGTSTANKIVVQGVCKPDDIVLIDRNCHKSHHYGLVLSGAQPLYLDAFPLVPYSMYGAVPLRTIKETLLQLKAEGKLERVRMLLCTNVTFDGHLYNVARVMEECLAIKPDLIFLWDEAWYAFGRFSPFYRHTRTAMGALAKLEQRYSTPEYEAEYATFKKRIGNIDIKNKKALTEHLLPDPEQVRLRVYATQSTHKSLSAFRQGSMIHVNDQDFDEDNIEAFEEAFMTHTSTSPNLQIIASLDLARRQAELEGYELVSRQIRLALEIRKWVADHPLISKYFHALDPKDMIPAEFRPSGLASYQDPSVTWKTVMEAWETDEFALDPTRITLVCGTAGLDGSEFKALLAENYSIQLNKTSRNTVLFQSNINNSRSATSYLIEVLAKIARSIDRKLARSSRAERLAFEKRVKSLMEDVPDLPNFSHFHDTYRDNPKSKTREGRMRDGYFSAYTAENCEHIKLHSNEIDERLRNGPELISANFVIPYPPGFPIMVPGQVISKGIIEFMRNLDVKEIHGYHAEVGIKMLKMPKA